MVSKNLTTNSPSWNSVTDYNNNLMLKEISIELLANNLLEGENSDPNTTFPDTSIEDDDKYLLYRVLYVDKVLAITRSKRPRLAIPRAEAKAIVCRPYVDVLSKIDKEMVH